MSGKLFIIGTPIGNLDDISKRVSDALRETDLIFVEDTRVTIKLLNHLGINKPMLSCHKHNEHERLSTLEKVAQDGRCAALVSDAGMPLISDPGSPLIERAIELGMLVVPIAGPSAFVLALVASGLPLDAFVFEGFLPDPGAALKEKLAELAGESRTMVFYVSPHKIERTLSQMWEQLGKRKACLARELTKLHEEFIRGDLETLATRYKDKDAEVRGEMVLVLAGAEKASQTDYRDWLTDKDKHREIMEHVSHNLKAGLKLSKAAGLAAEFFDLPKSDIYKEAVAHLKD